jgi:hypothetical protein
MPFHPTCFEIFIRASRLHFGRVDIHGLMGWRRLESGYEDFHNFPRDSAVSRGQEQWWSHDPGSEYLAANPIFIPALTPLLRSAVREEPSFSAQDGAFSSSELDRAFESSTRHDALSAATSQDPFMRFPPELTCSIIKYIRSRDIANLRLASRAFRQLPISLWHGLLREEMPWLWEVWSDDAPSFWATTSVPQLKAAQTARVEYQCQLQVYRDVIREEMPWMWKEWCDAEPPYSDVTLKDAALLVASTSIKLPRAQTNWYQLHRDITAHWGELKGLQNRRRIWKDVEEIISRVKKYREEGKILD